MNKTDLLTEARLDELLIDDLKLFQHPDYFCFSIDAVLLANFAKPQTGARIIDLGTGTGVIPHLLEAKNNLEQIYGIDIQAELIKLAQESANYNQLAEKLKFYHLDLRKSYSFFGRESFDYLVSNPPYRRVDSGQLSSSRAEAVAKYELKCDLEELIEASSQLIKYGGQLAYIYPTQRLAELLSLMEDYNLVSKRLQLVHSRAEEGAQLALVEATKGGGQGLEVLAPLVIYNDDGEYTARIKEIYGQKGD